MSQMMLNRMIEKPVIVDTEPIFTATLYAKVPVRDIQIQMGQLLQELSHELKRQGVRPTGPWFTHHLRAPSEYFDFEVCFPVATPIKASGRVAPGQWPAMKMVRTIYHGPYEGLGTGWGEFTTEIEAMKLQVTPEIWEVYRVGPESESDPAKWQTELSRAVV
jgi:effector-binding domain-containing protein